MILYYFLTKNGLMTAHNSSMATTKAVGVQRSKTARFEEPKRIESVSKSLHYYSKEPVIMMRNGTSCC